jgi:hypothetical protein
MEGMGVVERAVAAAQTWSAGDCSLDVGSGAFDRPFDIQALGQARSNR